MWRRIRCSLVFACCVFSSLECSDSTSPGASRELTVLFIGNSLTADNDLPALTQRITEAGIRTLRYETILAGGTSLEDHWEGGAADRISQVGADVVILQQGPSSLPENQVYLRTWAERFAPVIRAAGGTPALLMVWPESSRQEAFDDVAKSYRDAARAVGGLLIPAGESWLEMWERFRGAELYGPDGFHPSLLGSVVAALTVYAVVFEADPRNLPYTVAPEIPEGTLQLAFEAVARAVGLDD